MGDVDNEHNHGEPNLKVADDKKKRWNSFRRGKKQIKKLWKSKRTSKLVVEDELSSGDSQDNIAYDNNSDITNEELRISSPISPISTSSSVPSIMLHRASISAQGTNSSLDDMGATSEDEDEIFKENQNASASKGSSRDQFTLLLDNQSNVCIKLYLYQILDKFLIEFSR